MAGDVGASRAFIARCARPCGVAPVVWRASWAPSVLYALSGPSWGVAPSSMGVGLVGRSEGAFHGRGVALGAHLCRAGRAPVLRTCVAHLCRAPNQARRRCSSRLVVCGCAAVCWGVGADAFRGARGCALAAKQLIPASCSLYPDYEAVVGRRVCCCGSCVGSWRSGRPRSARRNDRKLLVVI